MLYILDRVGTESEGGYGGEEPEIRISVEEAENDTVRPDKPVMALEQLKPYYRGVYFATVSMNKKLVDEGLREKASRRGSTAIKHWSASTTRPYRRPSRRTQLRVEQ